MRWKTQYKKYPENGDTRIRSGFAFLRKEINGETRWFETVKWKETFRETHYSEFFDVWIDFHWLETDWVD